VAVIQQTGYHLVFAAVVVEMMETALLVYTVSFENKGSLPFQAALVVNSIGR